MFVDAIDLAEDRIERVLQRAVDRIALRRSELVEIRVDALSGLQLGLPVSATQVSRHFIAREMACVISSSITAHYIRLTPALGRATRAKMPGFRGPTDSVGEFGRRRFTAKVAVRTLRSINIAESAARIRSAFSRSPMWSSIMSAERSSAVGFARFLCAISGALPCTASNTAAAPEVRPRHDPEPAHQAGAEIRHDVAVEIGQQQDVEFLGMHHGACKPHPRSVRRR